MKDDYRKRIVSATPLMCLIAYLFIGFQFGIWHPTWAIFFLMPIMPFLLGLKKIIITWPVCCVFIYLIAGICFSYWHPGWLIFLTIPVVTILFPNKKARYED